MSFTDMNLNNWIALFLSNLSFSLFILAIVVALVDWPIQRWRQGQNCYAVFFRWLVLLPLGVGSLYGFIVHAFFPISTAALIGWSNSPFQFEVAMANLGIGLIAVIAFRASKGFRLATVIASACWLWGDALGHIYQMIAHQNFEIGNAGSWLWMDLVIPLALIFNYVKMRTCDGYEKHSNTTAVEPTTFGNVS